jgi:hypothetical protein
MLAYTIYIIGTRKFLPHEGKKNQRFLRDAYRDASQYFTSRFAPSVAASATAGSSSSSSVLLQSAAASPSAASAKLIGFGKAEYSCSQKCQPALFKPKIKRVCANFGMVATVHSIRELGTLSLNK